MIFKQLNEQLETLETLLVALSDLHYRHPSKYLGNATIGGHTRHILELLACTATGYKAGNVDYHNRKRNLKLETDIAFAQEFLADVKETLPAEDKALSISGDGTIVNSTYHREIVYNTEHIIHHLALIKVALTELGFTQINEYFGMAYSTIKYKEEQTKKIRA